VKRNLVGTATAFGVGLILFWATPAFAQPYDPNAIGITASSGCSVPGGSVTVAGTNFEPNEPVTLTLNGATLGTTTSGSTSSFSTTVKIPSNVTPGASYTIVATGTSGDTSSTVIKVAATCTAGSGLAFTSGSSSGLAFTGADIAAASGVGAVALSLGGLLILISRRRRATAE